MHLRSAKEAWDKLKDLYNPRLQRGRVRTYRDHSGRVIAVIAGVMGSDRLDRSDRHVQVFLQITDLLRTLKYLEKYLYS
ncbi:hypothetical protein L249_7109 [Ophiocordyceps polyrhachis-furcata BCC 54312]|uniref:Uncharacterized protein n=1 Tax=Ophiocordyceps polyrhachis-furcata BCC 54312 TaxID=1330021 RepID=A0A367LKX7_9HYPO|nr:hypothetical protein L249_7109 [Ophiocordyceps polyrhachis-furcata BCC 54312]